MTRQTAGGLFGFDVKPSYIEVYSDHEPARRPGDAGCKEIVFRIYKKLKPKADLEELDIPEQITLVENLPGYENIAGGLLDSRIPIEHSYMNTLSQGLPTFASLFNTDTEEQEGASMAPRFPRTGYEVASVPGSKEMWPGGRGGVRIPNFNEQEWQYDDEALPGTINEEHPQPPVLETLRGNMRAVSFGPVSQVEKGPGRIPISHSGGQQVQDLGGLPGDERLPSGALSEENPQPLPQEDQQPRLRASSIEAELEQSDIGMGALQNQHEREILQRIPKVFDQPDEDIKQRSIPEIFEELESLVDQLEIESDASAKTKSIADTNTPKQLYDGGPLKIISSGNNYPSGDEAPVYLLRNEMEVAMEIEPEAKPDFETGIWADNFPENPFKDLGGTSEDLNEINTQGDAERLRRFGMDAGDSLEDDDDYPLHQYFTKAREDSFIDEPLPPDLIPEQRIVNEEVNSNNTG
ncbi:hypothetical protein TWF730_002831 [Orbilia blumenaviensis]|uniref:Uncharacterized protein n=1 Tax=Orbilia blumenaviensis TaxID=1796055 RepID=A0AAV9UA88_9PEZI